MAYGGYGIKGLAGSVLRGIGEEAGGKLAVTCYTAAAYSTVGA